MKKEVKNVTIVKTSYIAEDGKIFSSERECVIHENIQKGEWKRCFECNGKGIVTKDNDYAGDGNWGSRCGVSTWEEQCPKCKGRTYLVKKEVWA